MAGKYVQKNTGNEYKDRRCLPPNMSEKKQSNNED